MNIGLHWGSCHNNFTLDGRFLDLEVPTLLGSPFFGVLRTDRGKQPLSFGFRDRGHIVGTEVLTYLRQMGSFVRYLRHRARWLTVELPHLRGATLDFLRELGTRLEQVFPRGHALFNALERERIAADMATRALDLSGREREFVRTVLRPYRLHGPKLSTAVSHRTPLERVDARLARTQPATRYAAFRFRKLGSARCRPSDEALAFNQTLDRLDQATDPDQLLDQVREAEKMIATWSGHGAAAV
jgi:hypothetical protein